MLRDQEADFILQNNKVVYPPVSTDGLELYYDVKGKKNSDLHKDKLLDMSGNDRHGELQSFSYKNLSGYQEDSELVFDGIDDTLKMPKLNGIDVNNFTYQLNNNILAFTGGEVKTVKNGDIKVGGRNLLRNSNFRDNGEHWNTFDNPQYEIKDNVVLSGGESAYVKLRQNLGQSIVPGDVYYARSEVRALSDFYQLRFQLGPNSNWRNSFGGTRPIKDEWVIVSGIVEAGSFDGYTFAITTDNRSDYDFPLWETKREVQLINLTATFGRGNEPSKEEADELFRVWTPAPEDLIETTNLKGNILGDMEDIVDDHTRDEQSGLEVFTDKADDSLVRVEVDGKSYQHAGPALSPENPIEIHSLNDFDVVSSTEKLSEGQLEEYDYDTEYENVYKTNILLSEPLRSVGDVKDRLFRDSDGLWKVERNVGIINNITGYNSFTVTRASTGRPDLIRCEASSPSLGVVPGQGNAISSHVPASTNSLFSRVTEESVDVHSSNGIIVLFLNSDRASTDAELRNWMSNNNVEIQYIMEPRVETLDQDLQDKLNNLRSFQDSNYVYTIINDITDISPSHISETLKPTIHTEFLAKDHYKENQTVNNLLIWNRSLEDEELLSQNRLFHGRFNMRSNTIEGEPISQEINLLSGGVFGHSLEQNYTIEI